MKFLSENDLKKLLKQANFFFWLDLVLAVVNLGFFYLTKTWTTCFVAGVMLFLAWFNNHQATKFSIALKVIQKAKEMQNKEKEETGS